MKFKRCFILEPNLKKSYGHVVEFPFTLQEHLEKIGIEAFVVCNKQIDKELLSSLKNTYSFISEGCFDDLSDKGEMYSKDLSDLNSKFQFAVDDLVINLTSYTNQVYGISKFINQNTNNKPTFCLWFHQFYPPTKVFAETLSSGFRKNIAQSFSEAFKEIRNFNNLHIFTTLSDTLRDEFEKLSQMGVHQLPLPYSRRSAKNKSKKDNNITFGFLGDGRFEKGALLVLELIAKDINPNNNYIFENIYPRGYSETDLNKLNNLKKKLSAKTNIKFIDEPLSNKEYKETLSKIDVFLMPYHPNSYDKRVSGIFIEATMSGTPVVATDHTWMAKEINQYKNGVVFDYQSGTNGLKKAMQNIISGYDIFQDKAILAGQAYNQIHSSENFINMLLKSLS